jgi:hypothetical protein
MQISFQGRLPVSLCNFSAIERDISTRCSATSSLQVYFEGGLTKGVLHELEQHNTDTE